MSAAQADPTTFGFTIVALSIALEETLKALAEKNVDRPTSDDQIGVEN